MSESTERLSEVVSSPSAGATGTYSLPRRDFLRLTALTVVAAPVLASAERIARFVPIEKGSPATALAPDARAIYRGEELRFIGMPIGGICAGQVYLGGDGRLWLWDVFNQIKLGSVARDVQFMGGTINAGGGANYVQPPTQVHPFAQGFALKVDGQVRSLDESGWKEISFVGEYPMAEVSYRDAGTPITVDLQSFSPFVPLDADDSGLPAVVMRYRVKNTGSRAAEVSVGGWLQNPAGRHSVRPGTASLINRSFPNGVEFLIEELKPTTNEPVRTPVDFELWRGDRLDGWTVEGNAFGTSVVPDAGGQRGVKSFRMVPNETNVDADRRTGKMISPEFTIDRRFIEFWIAGGNYPKTAYVGLVIDGQLVRSATGMQNDTLRLESFDVREFAGRKARLELVDAETGFWGQISVGPIRFVDQPSSSVMDAPDAGEFALLAIGADVRPAHDLQGNNPAEALFRANALNSTLTKPHPEGAISGAYRTKTLAPGEETTFEFVLAWRFPNLILSKIGRVGHFYAKRFPTARAAAEYTAQNLPRLGDATREWHATWYDSTLPRWFLDRTMANASILASMTCVRFENGRFYGWEGIGCCDGTCGHVWQYAHSVGRLFPALERSVREMADFKPGVGFHEDSGLIDFRGEYGFGYAADAQAGYVLRALREHQMSADDKFLRGIYPRVRQALEFLIREDTDDDGILEGRQHNTLDVDLYGPSSWLSSLYLAALRAGEEMANEMGDPASAKRWQAIFERGSEKFDQVFWNGSYYIHRLNIDQHPDSMRIGDGCEIDQLMGQQWAHQLGLGRIVGEKRTKQALQALYRNNFLPDLEAIRKVDPRGRWYGVPGESGLLMCTFPNGNRKEILGEKPTWASMYFNEVWTGQEYQAASHMIHEGLVEEGMRVVRAVHDRHHAKKRNPWNEVECSDHYARAMASHAAFIAACGYEYHGPKGELGFAPKIGAENFRAAFTAAEGWGTYRQKSDRGFEAGVKVRHGSLRLKTLRLVTNARGKVAATVGGRAVSATAKREGDRLTLTFASDVRLREGEELLVRVAS